MGFLLPVGLPRSWVVLWLFCLVWVWCWVLVMGESSSTDAVLLPSSAQGMERSDDRHWFSDILRDEAVYRLKQLGEVSDANGYLERTFMSPASMRASNLIRSWMEDSGLITWMDQIGNVHGRIVGSNSSAPALIIGSHLDTVIDAGIYDGSLGIVCAISALKALKMSGRLSELRRPIEIIAFSDEEGVRFQSTFLGSGAISGTLSTSNLLVSDKSGRMLQDVLKENLFEGTEESLRKLKYDPHSVDAYIEVHIEQGPVLDSLRLPLAIVGGIAGQTRLKATVKGVQGHAGTVPMYMRRDPMAAAAEIILLLENLCKNSADLIPFDDKCGSSTRKTKSESVVCTVGEISTWPSASNVIPGHVIFTIDIRSANDMIRQAVVSELSHKMNQTCTRRSVSCLLENKHSAEAIQCDDEVSLKLKSAAQLALRRLKGVTQDEVPVLMSGAGHDAMVMSHLTTVGMLFVRCRGGISHSPEESVLADDIWAAGLTLLTFLEGHL